MIWPPDSTNCRCRLSDTYYYIINLVAEDAFCLGTKARVPYMMFAETVRVSGVMFSTMEGKLKEIQTQNQMALRPIPTQPRNNQVRDARTTPLACTLAAAIAHQLGSRPRRFHRRQPSWR